MSAFLLARLSGSAAVALALLVAAGPAPAATIVDGVGRTVTVPDKITRVLPASASADLFVYAIAPDELVGMVQPWTADQKAFVPAAYRTLPAVPQVSRTMTPAQVQAVRDLKPDVIVEYGDITPNYTLIADAIETLTGIPFVFINGSLTTTTTAFRTGGDILGRSTRGQELSAFAQETLGKVVAANQTATSRPPIYYARGDDALQAVAPNNATGEVQDLAGGEPVVARGTATFVTETAAKVKALAPQVGVVDSDKAAAALAAILPANARILVDPGVPVAWVDNPPSVNRLIGTLWLSSQLHPAMPSPTSADYQAAWKTLFGFDVPADAIAARLKPRP